MESLATSKQGASTSWVEHQMLEHIKKALRVTLAWDAPTVSVDRKKSSIEFSLKSFRNHLERLMRLEEEGGYLRDIAEEKPYMQDKIDQLRADHDAFRRRVRELQPRLESIDNWQEEDFEDVCQAIDEMLADVDQHDLEEVRLLQDMLNSEVGGEG